MKQLKHKQNKTASSKTICSSVGRLVSLVILILMVAFTVIIFTNFTFNKADGKTKEEQVIVELKYNTNLPNELDLSISKNNKLTSKDSINKDLTRITVQKEAIDKYYNDSAYLYNKYKDIVFLYDKDNNSGLATDKKENNELTSYSTEKTPTKEPVTVQTVTQSAPVQGSISYTLTAYCYTGNPTASGVMPTANHTIAADLSIFPLGTKLSVNGIVYTVEDTGGAIHGNIFDIYFNSYEECINFGRQHTTDVYVVQ